MDDTRDALSVFSTETARFFHAHVGTPTAVQTLAWPRIAAGEDVLVSAPTGTGKTLAAFLTFIDQLAQAARAGALGDETQVIYVSPLKSLAADIRENLRRPLEGIEGAHTIRAQVRTGDTPQSQRARMVRKPPHILITTPESLYLMLTSRSGQRVLHTARAVIIDELHALIDTKRGAHLMLSLARLERLCGRRIQRVGLSATIEPLTLAAQVLSPAGAAIVAPKMQKQIALAVCGMPRLSAREYRNVWEEIAQAVYARCECAHSVIAFCEARRYAEKLSYYVNQLGGEDFSRVHHGSLSKEQRQETEDALRAIDGVAEVTAHQELADGFATIRAILAWVSGIVIGILVIVSLFIISNTIKMALLSRREEIGIMRMVGATNWFIRWPFVIEGMIMGLLGAVVSFFLQWLLYNLVCTRIAAMDSLRILSTVPFGDMAWFVGATCLFGGLLIGVLGSLLSIRRFLKV